MNAYKDMNSSHVLEKASAESVKRAEAAKKAVKQKADYEFMLEVEKAVEETAKKAAAKKAVEEVDKKAIRKAKKTLRMAESKKAANSVKALDCIG